MMTVPATNPTQTFQELIIMWTHRLPIFNRQSCNTIVLAAALLCPLIGCATGGQDVSYDATEAIADDGVQPNPASRTFSRVRFIIDAPELSRAEHESRSRTGTMGETYWVVSDIRTGAVLLALPDDGTRSLVLHSFDSAIWAPAQAIPWGATARSGETDYEQWAFDHESFVEEQLGSLEDEHDASAELLKTLLLGADDDVPGDDGSVKTIESFMGEIEGSFVVDFLDCTGVSIDKCESTSLVVNPLLLLQAMSQLESGTILTASNSVGMHGISGIFDDEIPTGGRVDELYKPSARKQTDEETEQDATIFEKIIIAPCAWPEGDPTPYVRARMRSNAQRTYQVCAWEPIEGSTVDGGLKTPSFTTLKAASKSPSKSHSL